MAHPIATRAVRWSTAFVLLGCGSDPSKADLQASGRATYEQPLVDGNTFACATCHALSEPSEDGLRRPAHPLGDATRRVRWKNGKVSSFLEASNSCLSEWMGVVPAWTDQEPRYVTLHAFLDSQSSVSAPAPPLNDEIVQPPTDVSGGDPVRGRSLFDTTCIVCHGPGGSGTVRGPRVANSQREPSYIARRIRTSGQTTSSVYDGLTGGVMPFWAKDRLSDPDLRDIVAFLKSPTSEAGAGGSTDAGGSGGQASTGDEPGSSGGGGVNEAGAGAQGGAPQSGAGNGACSTDHPRVGWRADLGINSGEGQVSGIVTMVDDCTLELTNFSYDGNGIDVRVYGSKVPTFKPGFSIGPDLVQQSFVKQTLRVQLPAGKTLDDLDWVSIWCVAVGANFGSGAFGPP